MKVKIPIHSVEEGIFDPDDSCVYGIGSVVHSIERFDLTKREYSKIYGGNPKKIEKDTEIYLKKNRRYTAKLKVMNDIRYVHYYEWLQAKKQKNLNLEYIKE